MTLQTTHTRTTNLLSRRSWLSFRAQENWMTVSASLVLATLILMALLAPVLAPYDPYEVSLTDSLQGPSSAHLLGTDEAGRDVLSRVLYAAQISLLGPLGVVIGSTILGVLVGIVAAWNGGVVDGILSRVIEILFAFPGVLLAILVVAITGPGLSSTVLALSIAYIPYMGRVTRSVAITERAMPYIQALETQGMPAWQILFRHLLPNIVPFVIAQATLLFGYAMIDLAALSFLGFGVQPPSADWGSMAAEGQSALIQGLFLPSLAPGFLIVLAVVSFSLLGEGLAERIVKRNR